MTVSYTHLDVYKRQLHDDLEPVLKKLLAADVILLGTPIYFGDVSAQMRALLERLWFPSLNYDKERTVNYPRDTVCGLVFTMNVDKPSLYDSLYQQLSGNMERLVGPTPVSYTHLNHGSGDRRLYRAGAVGAYRCRKAAPSADDHSGTPLG